MQMNAYQRLIAEFNDLTKNPPPGIGLGIGLVNDNYFHWRAHLTAPQDTVYSGGMFYVDITFPNDYPNHPPEFKYITPIYHLNVNPFNNTTDPLGHICLGSLCQWNGASVRQILQEIYALFYLGNPQSPYGHKRQQEYLHNIDLFNAKAKYFTNKYAGFNQSEDNILTEWNFDYNPGNSNNNNKN